MLGLFPGRIATQRFPLWALYKLSTGATAAGPLFFVLVLGDQKAPRPLALLRRLADETPLAASVLRPPVVAMAALVRSVALAPYLFYFYLRDWLGPARKREPLDGPAHSLLRE